MQEMFTFLLTALYLSLGTDWEVKILYVRSYLWHKYDLSSLSRLNDIVTSGTHFNILSEGSIAQLGNIVQR